MITPGLWIHRDGYAIARRASRWYAVRDKVSTPISGPYRSLAAATEALDSGEVDWREASEAEWPWSLPLIYTLP